MRKWKDNENIKIKYRKIYTFGACFIIFMSALNIAFFRYTVQDFISIFLGSFLLWGIWMNGLYKIMRKITEWKLKRSDNKFDYWHN